MKKYLAIVMSVIVFGLVSCDKEAEGELAVQPVLFEYEYVNHAWGYRHTGWMMNENGQILGFDLPKKWNWTDNDGYISKKDLLDNLDQSDTTYHQVDQAKMLDYFADRFDLLNARLDTSDTYMADAGIGALNVYIWDASKDAYKKQVIATSGDISVTNSSHSTKAMVQWLAKEGDKTDRFFWGF